MLSLVASSIGWKERKEHQPSGFEALNEVTEGKITIHLLCYQLCLWHLENLQIVALLNPQYRPHSQRLHFSPNQQHLLSSPSKAMLARLC
jgi:hypothetical protein